MTEGIPLFALIDPPPTDGQLLWEQVCEVVGIDGVLEGDGSVLVGFGDWLEEYARDNWTDLQRTRRLCLCSQKWGVHLYVVVEPTAIQPNGFFVVEIMDEDNDDVHLVESFASVCSDRFRDWIRQTVGFIYYIRTK